MENDRTASYDMRTYIGTKTIQARRMNAADAKHEQVPMSPEYISRSDMPNTIPVQMATLSYTMMATAHGYLPARVFEGSYKVADTHVDRLKIDLDELNERICMETRAINTFGVVSEEERWHLKKQLEAMHNYADVLYDRIRCAVEPRAAVSSEPSCCSAATTKEGR